MSFCKKLILVVSVTPVLLGGCAVFDPVEALPDSRLDQLVSGMDKCLANQAEASVQLRSQGQLLKSQSEQLAVLGMQLGAERELEQTGKHAAAIACPKAEKVFNKQVVGYREKVWLSGLELALTARMDTGTSSSSLDARNIEQFERDGKRWVRFELIHPETAELLRFERKIKRTVGVSSSDSVNKERRPVIKLGLLVGLINQTAEFTLYDRIHKTYQLTVGRDILQDVMVVDVSENYLAPYTLAEGQAEDGGDTP